MKEKYYFVVYSYTNKNKQDVTFSDIGITKNILINYHPLEWLRRVNNGLVLTEYLLLNWIEITEEEYNLYRK